MGVKLNVVVVNSKGKPFPVKGYLWNDGTVRVENPRPERYSHPCLVGDRTSMSLQWADKELNPVEASPFRIKQMIADNRDVRKTK